MNYNRDSNLRSLNRDLVGLLSRFGGVFSSFFVISVLLRGISLWALGRVGRFLGR